LQLKVSGKDERGLVGHEIDKKNMPQITTTITKITTTIIIMSL
jgi:hypothetical protein